MDYINYGNDRWKICINTDTGACEKYALNKLYGAVSGYLPYALTVCAENEIGKDDNVIYAGTLKSNSKLVSLAENGFYTPETKEEGYSVRIAPSPENPERKIIVIQGADGSGLLYGVYDFIHYYIDDTLKYNGYHYNYRHKPFIDACVDYERRSSPSIKNRGIWTWGHKLYDYRGFMDNMAACKMNMLIMWNDFVPLNAREIVEYAHSRGIKIIWGYACAWGVDVDPTSKTAMEEWKQRVVGIYREQYLGTGDGIYFQGFTETIEKYRNGEPIAALITEWINSVAVAIHSEYPDVYIQFGVHATSIGENYGMMKDVNPDVTLVWEDCGGFPYNYDPRVTDDEKPIDYTKSVIGTVSDISRRFGAVLKGFTVLNWKKFEHYKGSIIVGESDGAIVKKTAEDRRFYWDFAEPYWFNNAKLLKKYIKTIADAELTDSTVTALIEDGAFEAGVPKSVGLYSELLWNCEDSTARINEMVCHSRHYR